MPAFGDEAPTRMVLYARVSTDEQAASGLGLGVQIEELKRAAEYKRWRVVQVVKDEGVSGKDLNRPGLLRALELIVEGRADGLAVFKLDRLSRSIIDFGLLIEHLQELDARFVSLDLDVDTSTPQGFMVASVLVSVAQWERDTIADRTRRALAERRRQGKPISGPSVSDHPELAQRIKELYAGGHGLSLQAIANKLNHEGVPTLRGGKEWRPSSVSNAAGLKRRKPRRKTVALPDRKRGAR